MHYAKSNENTVEQIEDNDESQPNEVNHDENTAEEPANNAEAAETTGWIEVKDR